MRIFFCIMCLLIIGSCTQKQQQAAEVVMEDVIEVADEFEGIVEECHGGE